MAVQVKPEVKIIKEKKMAYLKTTKFRVSYPNVFQAKAIKADQEPKYSIQMLFPKKSDMKWLKDTVATVEKLYFEGKVPKNRKNPIKDGDEMTRDDGTEMPETKGMWVVSATTNLKGKPQVIDRNNEPMTEDGFYAGCYARASLTCKGYNTAGNKGITFYLGNIQKLEEGERFGNRKTAQDEFEVIEGDEDDSDNYSEDEEYSDAEFEAEM